MRTQFDVFGDFLIEADLAVVEVEEVADVAAHLAGARKLRDEGGGRPGLGLYAIMLPVLAVASFRPNFIDYYPMSGWVRGEIAVYASGGSNAHLTSFVLYEFACLHNPEFLIRATAELWYVSLAQLGRQRRGTGRR